MKGRSGSDNEKGQVFAVKKSYSAFEMRERDLHKTEIQQLLPYFRIHIKECGNLDHYPTEDLRSFVALLKRYKTKVHGGKMPMEAACQEISSRLALQQGELMRIEADS